MTTVALILFGVYVLAAGVFLVSENRRPQATLAWLLALTFLPGVGALVYVLFGRDRKAFSRQSKLLMQDLEPAARPLLAPLLEGQDARIARLEAESPTHRKLMTLVRRNSRSALTTGNRVEILQDAAAFYPRLVEDMRAARHSIHNQYFIWRADEFTEQLAELLAGKAKQGVDVRVLFDALGSQSPGRRAYFDRLRASGVRVAPTSPLWRLHTISYRNHRKITVVDGVVGYTGGMNIGKEHLDGGEGFDRWRDTQIRVAGDGAAMLQAVFAVDWYNAARENLFDAAHFPALEAKTAWGDGGVPVQILTSGPDAQWSAIQQLYASMVVAAQRHVYIQSPYFILNAALAEALQVAAMAGVEVRVRLSARESGNPLPTWAGNTYILDVIGAGVRVFLYHGGYLHAKTINVDSRICSIGSANVDIRSFSINYEINAVLYDDRLAAELAATFERDLADCTEFDPAEYRRRSAALRFRVSLTRLVSPLVCAATSRA
jgi:cardiolipin synthase